MRRPAVLLAVAALVATPPILARAVRTVEVTQEHRRFSVDALAIGRGDVVRFVNADEFLHQIYVRALGFSTPGGEEPGQHVDVTFPTSGTFEVRCEIHPRMLLTVTVQ